MTSVSLSSTTGGGTAERSRRLVRHLTIQGHDCRVAVMQGGDLVEELRAAGVPVYVTSSFRLVFDVPLVNPCRLAADVRRAEVVHLLGYWNLLSVATAALAVLFGKPYVLCAAGEFAALEHPRPAVRAFHLLLGRHVVRHASTLMSITELERSQIIERFDVAPSRVVVVPNGVEPAPTDDGATVALPPEPYILFVGRLAEIKGPDLLLSAFAAVARDDPRIVLVVAGPDFGMETALRRSVSSLGLGGRVRFTGHLGEADRTAAYRGALFLVVPSRAEAMSLVALEAGAVGRPVLLTDQCGFDEVETLGGGRVVPASVDGLADGMRQLLGHRELLAASGEKLRRHVEQRYAWPAITTEFVAHLRSLVEVPSRVEREDRSRRDV